jgi:CRP-like cAMP-binding protein
MNRIRMHAHRLQRGIVMMLARRRALHAEQGERQHDKNAPQRFHACLSMRTSARCKESEPIITQPRCRADDESSKQNPGLLSRAGVSLKMKALRRAHMLSIIT